MGEGKKLQIRNSTVDFLFFPKMWKKTVAR